MTCARCARPTPAYPCWPRVGPTSDPLQALDKLLARDALFTERLRRDCARLGLPTRVVDVGLPEDELLGQVEVDLGL